MKIPLLPILLLILAAPCGQVFGQEAVAEKDAAVEKEAAPKEAVEKDSHTLAVEEFFVAMKMKETSDKTIDQMLMMQVQQQPQLAQFKDVMTTFLRKYVSYEALKGEMVKLYKSEFTEDEVRQMTAFYLTPVGKKAVAKLPTLTATGAQLGMQRVQANMGELQQAIAKRTAELQSE